MKKIIIFLLGILAACVIGLIVSFISKDIKEEDKFKKEYNEVISYFENLNSFDEEGIEKHLSVVVSLEDYGKVEKAYKSYLHDFIKDMDITKIAEVLNDKKMLNVLSVDNYQNDGPAFAKTKKYLEENISFLSDKVTKYDLYMGEEKIMSYISTYELNDYYKKLYETNIKAIFQKERESKNLINNINKILSFMKNTEKVIDFLSDNKDYWFIEDGQISFRSESVLNEYNGLLEVFKN